jgi:hypothetical protein
VRTEDDLRAAFASLEQHAPAAVRVMLGTSRRATRSRGGLRSPRAIRLLTGITTAAALAGVITALTLPGGTLGTIPNVAVASSAPIAKATLQAKLLAAFSATSDEIVYLHGTFWSTGSGWTHTDMSPITEESWYYPWQARTGQHVRSRTLTYKGDGGLHTDKAVSYVMPPLKAGLAPGSFQTTGDQIVVDYAGKEWYAAKNYPFMGDPPDNPALIAFYLKSKQWSARNTTLNGRPAIELTMKDVDLKGKTVVNSWTEYLWVDASTYLPLRDTETFGPPNMLSHGMTDWQYLPITPANLAKLTPPIPSGFRQVAPPRPISWHPITVSPTPVPSRTSAVPSSSASPSSRAAAWSAKLLIGNVTRVGLRIPRR